MWCVGVVCGCGVWVSCVDVVCVDVVCGVCSYGVCDGSGGCGWVGVWWLVWVVGYVYSHLATACHQTKR